MSEPWDDPEVVAWKKRVEDELVPMILGSTVCVSLAPRHRKTDIKFALELGLSIMMNKPVVVVAHTNDDVPPKLRQIADKVVIGEIGDPGFNERLMEALRDIPEPL